MIVRKESASRAGEGEYWKIDYQGNESKLVITDSLGRQHDIRIWKVIRLSKRLIAIDPDPIQIMNLIAPIGENAMVAVPLFGYLSLVDTKTGKLYRWPDEYKYPYLADNYDWNLDSKTDEAGNVYFSLHDRSRPSPLLMKLDVTKYTMQPLLPKGLDFTDYAVTDDGFVIVWRLSGNYFVRCPAGNIIPLTGTGFCMDNKLYSLEERTVFFWEPVGTSELRKVPVCPAERIAQEAPLLINTVRRTAVFEWMHDEHPGDGFFWAAEFDGTAFSAPFRLPAEFRDPNRLADPDFPVTSQAWYLTEDNALFKLPMQSYEAYRIPLTDYRINRIVSDPARPDLHFTGFRYDDGMNVAGTITEEDKIVVDTETDHTQITELIPIN